MKAAEHTDSMGAAEIEVFEDKDGNVTFHTHHYTIGCPHENNAFHKAVRRDEVERHWAR